MSDESPGELTRTTLLAFMRRHRLAVQSTVSPAGLPEAALVGIAIGDDFEIVFDTLQTSRKAQNLRRRPEVALVIGGWATGEVCTVQYEGVADEPSGEELARARDLYFGVYPDGRDRLSWPDLIHVRVRPRWVRYSDFGPSPARILEFNANELAWLT